MDTTTLPQWTAELTETFVKGEDQLGLEGAAQSYQQYLVPGVITTTDHARYYSFYAWVLHRFINLPGSSRLLRDFRGRFFRRHEMAFLLSAYSHHKDGDHLRGLVGAGVNSYKVRGYWSSGDPVSLDFDYFGNKLGGFGQYYRPAMETLGIIAPPEHSQWVYRLTRRGEALARAYDEAIAETRYHHLLAERDSLAELSHADAEEYGRVGCLCAESLALGKDRDLLRDAFFRFDQSGDDNPHVCRRKSLGVALDLVAQAQGAFTTDMLRPALYLGEYEAGRRYRPTEAIRPWVERWRMVEIRHMYTFGLQCLWAAFLLYVSQHPNGIALDAYLDWVRNVASDTVWSMRVSDLLDDLVAEVGLASPWAVSHPDYKDACLQDTGNDEYSRYLRITGEGQSSPGSLIVEGLRILMQLYLRFWDWRQSGSVTWQELGERPRLPLQTYMDELRAKLDAQPEWTVESWFKWVYREYVLGQHEFIALQKLRYQGYDTFKFYYRDGLFFWPFVNSDAYQEPLRLASNRINNLLSILVDLGLLLLEEDRYRLSVDGERYWQQTLEAMAHA